MLLEMTSTELAEIITSELNRLIPHAEIEGQMTKDDFMILSDEVVDKDTLSNLEDLDDVTEFLDEEGVQICDTSHIAKIITHAIYKN